MNDIKKLYISRLRKSVPHKSGLSKKTLKQIENDIEACIAEKPDMDFQSLCKIFGSPEDIAESIRESEPQANMLHKKRIVLVSLAVLVVLCIIISLLVHYYMTTTTYHAEETTNITKGYKSDNSFLFESGDL